jgi:hypothetical protein
MIPLLMNVEQLVELELTGVGVVLTENASEYNIAHHTSQVTWPPIEPGPSRWEAGD